MNYAIRNMFMNSTILNVLFPWTI